MVSGLLETLSRDDLIVLVQRLRRVVDVRELEIRSLEGELDAAHDQLAALSERLLLLDQPELAAPEEALAAVTLGSSWASTSAISRPVTSALPLYR
jgi:hypothetical protein